MMVIGSSAPLPVKLFCQNAAETLALGIKTMYYFKKEMDIFHPVVLATETPLEDNI